jgi:hypothetical protein
MAVRKLEQLVELFTVDGQRKAARDVLLVTVAILAKTDSRRSATTRKPVLNHRARNKSLADRNSSMVTEERAGRAR